MRILITGGAGYLGTVTVQTLLDAGHEVRILDSLIHGDAPALHLLGRTRFELVRGDVRDPAAVESALRGMEAVVHLAAIVGDPACAKSPEVARAVNLDASVALFAAASRAGVGRFLFASTCSNYGRMAETTTPATEDHPLRPVSFYAEAKVAVEQRLLAERDGAPAVTVLRFATLHGLSPRMRFDLTVNEFTMELARGNRLTVFGEQFWRPYVHVRDAARAIHLALESAAAKGRVLNVGDTTENHRKLDLVGLIHEVIPQGQVDFVHRAEDPRDYKVAFERIHETLGFTITRRVRDGIREIEAAMRAGFFKDADAPCYRNI
jgi:nucleoside-diphosphate-sugar epimerase